MKIRPSIVLAAATAASASPGLAAEIGVSVEIPRLNVAEYHRPYVAIWLERADQTFAGNLAVWYDLRKRNDEGTQWLKDMRAWWRKSGRELAMPVDGLSGATRAPGEHTVSFGIGKPPFDRLAPGEYRVVVEAAREVGGREVVRVPLQWPPTPGPVARAQGEHELGSVRVAIRP
jgi:hypothetical protein